MLYLFFVLYHYKLNLEHCVSNDVTGPFGCEKLENQECSTSHLKVNHDRVFILANFSCQLTDRRLSENLTTNGLLLLHSILIRLACVLCHCSKPIECLQCVRVSSWKKKESCFHNRCPSLLYFGNTIQKRYRGLPEDAPVPAVPVRLEEGQNVGQSLQKVPEFPGETPNKMDHLPHSQLCQSPIER